MTATEEKIIQGLPAKDYHARKEVSSTHVRNLLKCPQLAMYRQSHPIQSKALEFGEAFHTAMLEPLRFKKEYKPAPIGDRRTTRVKEAWDDLKKKHPNATILKTDEFDDLTGMYDSVMNHRQGGKFLHAGGDIEVTLLGHHKPTDTGLRCRCDILLDDMIVDLKSTVDASLRGFARSVIKFGYHIQAAFYQMIVEQVTGKTLPFRFIVVEKKAPYLVGVYQLDDRYMDLGRSKVYDAMQIDKFASIRGVDNDGYGEFVQKIQLPAWASEVDDDNDE